MACGFDPKSRAAPVYVPSFLCHWPQFGVTRTYIKAFITEAFCPLLLCCLHCGKETRIPPQPTEQPNSFALFSSFIVPLPFLSELAHLICLKSCSCFPFVHNFNLPSFSFPFLLSCHKHVQSSFSIVLPTSHVHRRAQHKLDIYLLPFTSPDSSETQIKHATHTSSLFNLPNIRRQK